MKRLNTLIAAITCAALSQVAGSQGLDPYTADPGTAVFDLPDLKGNVHTLDEYRGRVVLVNFWASWCPPCIQEMPALERLQQVMDEQPFDILAINVGEQKYRVWKFVKLVNFNLPVLLDERKNTFNEWGLSVLPTSFLFDRKGNIRYRVVGDVEWDSKEVIALVEALINEEGNEQ